MLGAVSGVERDSTRVGQRDSHCCSPVSRLLNVKGATATTVAAGRIRKND